MKRTGIFRGSKFFLVAVVVCALATFGCRSPSPSLPKIPFVGKKNGSTEKMVFSVEGPVRAIRADDHWRHLAVLSGDDRGGQIDLFRIEYETPVLMPDEFTSHRNLPSDLAFDAAGKNLLVAAETATTRTATQQTITAPSGIAQRRGAESGGEVCARLFSLEQGTSPTTLVGPESSARAIRFAPKSDWLAVQNSDRSWELIDRLTPERRVIFPEKILSKQSGTENAPVTSVLAFSPDGEMVATLVEATDSDGTMVRSVVIWDLKVIRSIPLDEAKENPSPALFVSRFSLTDEAEPHQAIFSPNGQMIAFPSKPRYVGVWQTASGRLLTEFGEHRQEIGDLAFAPSNAKLAVGTGGINPRLVLWEVRKGRILRTFDDLDTRAKQVSALAFSPDGKTLWYGNELGEVKEWFPEKAPKKEK